VVIWTSISIYGLLTIEIYSTGSSSIDDGASWDDASQGRPVLRLAVEHRS